MALTVEIKSVAAQIKYLRLVDRDWSQQQLVDFVNAIAPEVRLTQQRLSEFENGVIPDFDEMVAIAAVFEIPLENFGDSRAT